MTTIDITPNRVNHTDLIGAIEDKLSILVNRIEANELRRSLRVARKLETTREGIKARVARAKRRIMAEKYASLSLEIHDIAGGLAWNWHVDHAELIGLIWDDVARQTSRIPSSLPDDFWTNKAKRRQVLSRIGQQKRSDLYAKNRRDMGMLMSHEMLVNTVDPNRVIGVQSAGSNPDRNTQYVDGTGRLISPMRTPNRVRETFMSRLPNPDDINEYGVNRFGDTPEYVRRIRDYFGPNGVEKAVRIEALFEAIISSYRWDDAAANTVYKEAVSVSNMGKVRWQKRRNSEKGRYNNVRDIFDIPRTVSAREIANEAARWAQIALYREPSYVPQLGDKRRTEAAELILQKAGHDRPNYVGWTRVERSNNLNDTAAVSWSLGGYRWQPIDPDDENSALILVSKYQERGANFGGEIVYEAELIGGIDVKEYGHVNAVYVPIEAIAYRANTAQGIGRMSHNALLTDWRNNRKNTPELHVEYRGNAKGTIR